MEPAYILNAKKNILTSALTMKGSIKTYLKAAWMTVRPFFLGAIAGNNNFVCTALPFWFWSVGHKNDNVRDGD